MEQFFYETIGQPYSTIIDALERSMSSLEVATMRDIIDRQIIKVRRRDAIVLSLCRCNARPCSSSFCTCDPTGTTRPEDGDI